MLVAIELSLRASGVDVGGGVDVGVGRWVLGEGVVVSVKVFMVLPAFSTPMRVLRFGASEAGSGERLGVVCVATVQHTVQALSSVRAIAVGEHGVFLVEQHLLAYAAAVELAQVGVPGTCVLVFTLPALACLMKSLMKWNCGGVLGVGVGVGVLVILVELCWPILHQAVVV